MSKDPVTSNEILDLIGDFVYNQGRLSMDEVKTKSDRDVPNWNPGLTLSITLKWLMDCQAQYTKELAVRDVALKKLLGEDYEKAILSVQGIQQKRKPKEIIHAENADEEVNEAGC